MRRSCVAFVGCVVTSLGALDARAHPGGTDRFGCHVDSSTGIRHCHGGDGGSSIEFAWTAEIGAEVGGVAYSGPEAWIGYQAAAYLQHDGSLLTLAGLTFPYGN